MARSIEEVLNDYAQPFVALSDANARRPSQAALDTAAAIWDLVIDGLSTEEIVRTLDEDADAHVIKMVDAFVERKRRFYAADSRYIVGPRVSRREAR